MVLLKEEKGQEPEKDMFLISETAKLVGVESHVLRYWEEELKLPIRRNDLGHRYYTKEDVDQFREIKKLKEQGLQLKAIRTVLTDSSLQVMVPLREHSQAARSVQEELAETGDREIQDKGARLQLLLHSLISQAVRENNEELTIFQLKRAFAKVITGNGGMWWFDMWGGWYATKRIMDEMRYLRQLADLPFSKALPVGTHAAVMIDETLWERHELYEENIPLVPHRARQMTRDDYLYFDYLIGMDSANIRNMTRIAGGTDSQDKIYKMLSFVGYEDTQKFTGARDVADPWYTGNFDETYEDVVEGCEGFLKYLEEHGELSNKREKKADFNIT